MPLSIRLTRRLDAAGIPYDETQMRTTDGRARFALDYADLVPFNPRDEHITAETFSPDPPPRWTRARVDHDRETITCALAVLARRPRFRPPAIGEFLIVHSPPVVAPVDVPASIAGWETWADEQHAAALDGDLAAETTLAAAAAMIENAAVIVDELERTAPRPRSPENVRRAVRITWVNASAALQLLEAANLAYSDPARRGRRYAVIGTPVRRRVRALY